MFKEDSEHDRKRYIKVGCVTAVVASMVIVGLNMGVVLGSSVGWMRKMIAVIVDFVHMMIMSMMYVLVLVILVELVVEQYVDVAKVLVLNVVVFVVILSFFVFRMCLMSIWYNALLGLHPCRPFMKSEEVMRWYERGNMGCHKNTDAWIKSWLGGLLGMIVVNGVVLIAWIRER